MQFSASFENYKQKYSLEERRKSSQMFLQKYPDLVPVIVEKHQKAQIKDLPRIKYLANKDMDFRSFKEYLKKQLELTKIDTIFCYLQNRMVDEHILMGDLYSEFKDKEDGLLYLTYADYQVFG